MQALESLLNNYKARHVECLHGTSMPRKYIVVEMWDEYAGLGNQFPSIITGALQRPTWLCCSAIQAGSSLGLDTLYYAMKAWSCHHWQQMVDKLSLSCQQHCSCAIVGPTTLVRLCVMPCLLR